MARSSLFRSLKKCIRVEAEARKQNTTAENLLGRIQEAKLTRRQFLGTTIAAAGVLTLPPLLRPVFAVEIPTDPVVVLGAGYAGLAAAYRLAKAKVPFVVYEAAGRFGGRVHTQYKFNKDGMFCELGGELIDTGHTAIIKLAAELGLPLDDFEDYDAKVEKVAYEHKGAFYSQKDMLREVKPLVTAVVRDLKLIYGPDNKEMITWQNPRNARKFDLMTLEEYLNSVTDMTAWARDMVKVAYVGEYGLEADKQSALNLLLLIGTDLEKTFDLFGDSDELKRVRGGNSRLAEALAAKAGITQGKDGARIKYRHALTAWKQKGSAHLLTFSTGGAKSLEVKASQVICTIPFSILRGVEGVDGLGFSDKKLKAIRELTYGTNSKLMLGFHRRIWREAKPGAKVAATNGGLYSEEFQSVWDTSRLQKGNSGIITNYTGGLHGAGLSLTDADAVTAAVDRFYPGAKALRDPRAVSLMNWPKHPHAKGSFTCPGPGHFTEFFGAIGTEELGGSVQFAGEHCSLESQAFMNGSVETGEAAAAAVVRARKARQG